MHAGELWQQWQTTLILAFITTTIGAAMVAIVVVVAGSARLRGKEVSRQSRLVHNRVGKGEMAAQDIGTGDGGDGVWGCDPWLDCLHY